jgi:hypothetical protein
MPEQTRRALLPATLARLRLRRHETEYYSAAPPLAARTGAKYAPAGPKSHTNIFHF